LIVKFIVGMTCALVLAPGVASAGEKTGRITSVHLAQQHVDKVFVQIEGAYTNEPTCSNQVSSWDFVLDISQSTGKAIYAQLIAAQYSQTPLQVVGLGTCLLHNNYETLSYIVVAN
jgi:hypothetical protein